MKIKDICTSVTDGSHNPPQGIEKSEYMMLSSKNIFDDEITFDEPRFLSQKDFEREHKRTKIAVGDVLLTIVGTVGRTAVVDEDMPAFALQRSVAVLHPKNDVCLPRFLMYALRGKRTYIENRAKGVAQKGIYLKEVSDIDIYIPDISNQEIIINKLDKVNAIIKLRQEELLALDDLIKARFVEMFGDPVDNSKGWEKKQLQEIVTDDCAISYGIVQTGDDQENGVPVFRPVDIVNKIPRLDDLKKTTEEISNKYKRTILKGREMLITVRANIADTCIVGEEFKGCNVGRGIVPIRTQEDIMVLEFLKCLIDNKHLNDAIKSKAKGITLIQLNMEDLREVELIIPPIDQQNEFVEFTNQVNKSKVAVQKALDETQMLFDSLMQEYFN